MDLRKISDSIYEAQDDRMYKMNDIYYEMADYIKEVNPSMYNQFVEEAEDILYCMDDEDAQMIVRNMMPFGERWTMSDIYNFVRGQGEEPCIDWYMVMNMMYNDYRPTAQKYGADTPEFYFSLSKDFIHDPDAKPHKVEKYFTD